MRWPWEVKRAKVWAEDTRTDRIVDRLESVTTRMEELTAVLAEQLGDEEERGRTAT